MPNAPRSPDQRRDALLSDFPPVSTEAWHQQIIEDLRGDDYERRLVWRPLEGFAVHPFYRAEDLETLTPGFLQAVRPHAADNDWHIRQDVAVHDAATANRVAREALAHGATTVGFRFTPPHHALRQADLERLLDGIVLEETPLHWVGAGATRPLLAGLFNEAARRGMPLASLQGSVTTDPFTRLVRQGRLDAGHAFDEAARLLDEVATSGASLHTLCIDLQPFHQAGASAVQELAVALAAASDYAALLTERGAAIAAIARGMQFVVPVGGRYLMEIAKLRALRVLLGSVFQAYGEDGADTPPHIEAVTSGWTLTRYDPHSNLLRATTQAAAAVIGGCHTLRVCPFDAASGPPSETAFRLARNLQLLLKHEAHLDRVADPAAGSYYLETLTDHLARHAWSFFQQIEARGGLLKALEQGFVQQAIQTLRDQRDSAIAEGRRVFVGTNAFPNFDERLRDRDATGDAPSPTVSPSPYFATETVLDAFRALLRDGATLADLPTAMPSDAIIEAEPLPATRGAEAFEALRLRTERHTRRTGHCPSVFLLPIGPPVPASARASFARNAFGCAGFAIVDNERFETIDEATRAALDSQADMVVLCSANADYASYAPALSERLAASDPRPLFVVAGYPQDLFDILKAAGVDALIHQEQNLLDVLTRFQGWLGIQ